MLTRRRYNVKGERTPYVRVTLDNFTGSTYQIDLLDGQVPAEGEYVTFDGVVLDRNDFINNSTAYTTATQVSPGEHILEYVGSEELDNSGSGILWTRIFTPNVLGTWYTNISKIMKKVEFYNIDTSAYTVSLNSHPLTLIFEYINQSGNYDCEVYIENCNIVNNSGSFGYFINGTLTKLTIKNSTINTIQFANLNANENYPTITTIKNSTFETLYGITMFPNAYLGEILDMRTANIYAQQCTFTGSASVAYLPYIEVSNSLVISMPNTATIYANNINWNTIQNFELVGYDNQSIYITGDIPSTVNCTCDNNSSDASVQLFYTGNCDKLIAAIPSNWTATQIG